MKIPESVERGMDRIKSGKIVLIYDSADREGETDLVMPASAVTPRDVAYYRNEGGGLICVAIHPVAADKLGLPLISDILRSVSGEFSGIRRMVEEEGDISYDNHSSFSLWVNHRDTFTGITDTDRALTIEGIGQSVTKALNGKFYDFCTEFRTPGHVSILKAADRLLDERRGQTELSVVLALLAGISPAMAICEMLDNESGRALSKEDAVAFASERDTVFIEGKDIVEAYQTVRSIHPPGI